MDEGDYDNALAACKSDLSADSDAVEDRYDSDYTLLHLLEAKCHLLRGNPDAAAPAFERARQSYRITHPQVREIFAQRQDWLATLRLSRKQRRELKILDDDNAINAKIQQLDAQLEEASRQIDADRELGSLLTGRYNALLVFPQGKSPTKRRIPIGGAVFRRRHRQGSRRRASDRLDCSRSVADAHLSRRLHGARGPATAGRGCAARTGRRPLRAAAGAAGRASAARAA